MRLTASTTLLLFAATTLAAQSVPDSARNAIVERYRRAESMLTSNTKPLILGDAVSSQWLPDGHRFWYRVTRPGGAEFMLVDPAANSAKPAFDAARIAAVVSALSGKAFDAAKPPFRTFKFVDNERAIEFQIDSLTYTCTI